jgi:sec-independent protein translocase protein TatA
MPALGPTALILVLAILVLIFGASRLAEVGGALGRSVRECRRATDEDHAATSASGPPSAPPACRRCGVVLHSGARFCGSCGTAVAPEDLGASLVPTGPSPPVGGNQ